MQAPDLSLLSQQSPDVVLPHMPQAAAFQVLTADCTAEGAGTQTRRSIVDCFYLCTGRKTATRRRLQLPLDPQAFGKYTLEELQGGTLLDSSFAR